jgi:hypothetical protein
LDKLSPLDWHFSFVHWQASPKLREVKDETPRTVFPDQNAALLSAQAKAKQPSLPIEIEVSSTHILSAARQSPQTIPDGLFLTPVPTPVLGEGLFLFR